MAESRAGWEMEEEWKWRVEIQLGVMQATDQMALAAEAETSKQVTWEFA